MVRIIPEPPRLREGNRPPLRYSRRAPMPFPHAPVTILLGVTAALLAACGGSTSPSSPTDRRDRERVLRRQQRDGRARCLPDRAQPAAAADHHLRQRAPGHPLQRERRHRRRPPARRRRRDREAARAGCDGPRDSRDRDAPTAGHPTPGHGRDRRHRASGRNRASRSSLTREVSHPRQARRPRRDPGFWPRRRR